MREPTLPLDFQLLDRNVGYRGSWGARLNLIGRGLIGQARPFCTEVYSPSRYNAYGWESRGQWYVTRVVAKRD